MKSPVTSCFVIKKRGATYVTPPIVFFPNLNQDYGSTGKQLTFLGIKNKNARILDFGVFNVVYL